MKILIVKRDKLGDMLVTTPMLRVLREALPAAEIHLLASRYNAWVVEGNRCIDRTWIYGRVRTGRQLDLGAGLAQLKLYVDLKRQRFDFAIAAGGEESPRALARALHAGAKRTVGYATTPQWQRKLSDPLVADAGAHESVRIARMLAPLGIALPAELPPPEFSPAASALEGARRWLAARKLAPSGFIVLGLGARIAQKQPEPAQILRWAAWARQVHGLDTVFLWTPGAADDPLYPGDDHLAQTVLDARLDHVHPFRGTLQEAIALVFCARTSVIPDSGMMHFAAASPGGVLGLFADTGVWSSPVQWAPLGARARVVVAEKKVGDLDDATIIDALQPLLPVA